MTSGFSAKTGDYILAAQFKVQISVKRVTGKKPQQMITCELDDVASPVLTVTQSSSYISLEREIKAVLSTNTIVTVYIQLWTHDEEVAQQLRELKSGIYVETPSLLAMKVGRAAVEYAEKAFPYATFQEEYITFESYHADEELARRYNGPVVYFPSSIKK